MHEFLIEPLQYAYIREHNGLRINFEIIFYPKKKIRKLNNLLKKNRKFSYFTKKKNTIRNLRILKIFHTLERFHIFIQKYIKY